MRLDVKDWGPGFTPARVLLDGKEVRDCVVADEESCEVEVLVRDTSGNLLFSPGTGQLSRTTLRGIVKIIPLALRR